jgi:hypothetical protein
MNVQVRINRGSRRMSAQRRRAESVAARTATPATEPAAPRARRTGGPSQDIALYNCQCGYVFNAPVSTTVGCPHCGGTQAW